MNILRVLDEATRVLKRRVGVAARLDAEVLLSHCVHTDRVHLYARSERVLTVPEREEFASCVRRRLRGEPVAYIVGEKEFWSLLFEVNHHVLIPRPETEILVEEVLKICHSIGNSPKILEIGTGCGAISVSLAHELRRARIVATDISREAISVAMSNAKRHGVEHQISFHEGSLFQPVSGFFDVIVSNPPYISEAEFARLPRDVHEFEPETALLAGADGHLFHREIARLGASHLEGGGWLLMEIGSGQRDQVQHILGESGFYDSVTFRTDYAGLVRVSIARRNTAGG